MRSDSSPAVSQQPLEDVRRSRRAENGPLDASVFEVAAFDLVGAEPLFDSLLDAVALGEAHRTRPRGETVVHKVHRVLIEGEKGHGRGWSVKRRQGKGRDNPKNRHRFFFSPAETGQQECIEAHFTASHLIHGKWKGALAESTKAVW